MTSILRAMTGLALIVPAFAGAQAAVPPSSPAKSSAAKHGHAAQISARRAHAKAHPVPAAPASGIVPSDDVRRVADWVAASHDNHGLPWAIVDKPHAALFLFDPQGKPLAQVPVLVGIAIGDEASPGVGSKTLAALGPAEKTTPAGRFLAKFGLPVEGQRVLWVDYATSVALHPIPPDAGSHEHRRERMLSPTPDDNRITFGCINVPKAFYTRLLSPQFRKKGGYVYVLPDRKPLDDVFPMLRSQPEPGA